MSNNDVLNTCKEEDLNEDSISIQNGLEMIREWLRKQPHLNVRDDDESLLIFLRSSKYSIQRTKEKLDNYYSMITLLPEMFDDRDPFASDIQTLLNVGTMVPLPNTLGKCGPRIIFYGCGYDPVLVPYTTIMKVCLMMYEILMAEDLNTVAFGIYLLFDLKRFSLKYVLQLTPTILTQHVYCTETGYPLRLKGIQIDNCPPAMDVIIKIANACLKGKVSNRFHVYREDSNLQKEIPLEMLPIEHGGKNGSIKELGAIWKKKMESYREWFRENAKYKTNENLRPGPPKTSDSELGIDGSFRKLAVD
ncbi:retinol-binding protein pinta-like [Photinus pyralis]|uniref:retinol-binding protein pinta-like n=1 Tax=Photinus pyralis TaxID=7054 RepID=UPI0012676360|nr:retinol-binding protein pinta-like [Photinus pyralis]